MAHNSTITSGGIQFEVTEFDHTAQEIDDSVDRSLELEKKTLELEETTDELKNTAVKKTGDTLTGQFIFRDPDGVSGAKVFNSYGFKAVSYADVSDISSDRNSFAVNKPSEGLTNALLLMRTEKKDGVTRIYEVFHEGNKPRGSYTGNGSATKREIPLGVNSNIAIYIHGENTSSGAIITRGSGIVWTSSGIKYFGHENAALIGENITLLTTDDALNANGVTYKYYALY